MPNRYYVANATGGYDGPFEADAVREKVRAGQINPATQVFREHGQQWQPLSTVPELIPAGPLRQPPPPRPGGAPPTQAPLLGGVGQNSMNAAMHLPKLGFVAPVLVTLFCCVLGGIISLVYTSKANTAAVTGDVHGYEGAKRARTGWIVASVVIGFIAIALWVVMVFMAEFAAQSAEYGY